MNRIIKYFSIVIFCVTLSLLGSCTTGGVSQSLPESDQSVYEPSLEKSEQPPAQFRIATPTAYYYYQLGTLASAFGNQQEAISYYQRAAKIDEESLFLRVELARLFASEGMFQEAETEIQHALTLDPNNIAALMILGGVYTNQEKYDRAIDIYTEILQYDPKNVNT